MSMIKPLPNPLVLLFLVLLMVGAGASVQAAEKFCSDYGGVIDGNVLATPPGQITIDTDCTFQNWTEPTPLETTVNFQTNDPTIYLIVFDNVDFTGHMACASVDHRIWFSNGSDYGSSNSCQDLFIPVETIQKQSPSTTASIGDPFTYTLTLPAMTEVGGPSANDLHTVTLWDDLTATGVDLTYVDVRAYYKDSGDTVTLEKETDPNAKGGVWTPKNLSYKPIPLIRTGEQIVVEFTVVLDDTPANVEGTSFTNTAKWWFGRLIDDTFYEPLPGEWGISEPMIIAEPDLVVMKSTDETALNLGVPTTFTIDVQNTGGSDIWNATIIDQLPDSADAGMCDYDPRTDISTRIVSADGTVVSELTAGEDYAATYDNCQLGLTMLSDKARIAPDQHLTVTYSSQLDADTTGDGLALTNVAGATGWFSAANSSGRTYTRTLTDGTPGVLDHQDSQTVTTALSGYYFQKTVENLDSGENPASVAAPGDRLRYRLRLFNVDQTIDGIMISDSLDLNGFDPGTFEIVSLPEGAVHEFDPATGLLEIHGGATPLNVAVGGEIVIEFEVDLEQNLANGTVISNQAALSADGLTADSDDPYVNGIAGPGDPTDPTTVVIRTPGPLSKANTQPAATIGERFKYTVAVPAEPVGVPLYDVRILDDLLASDAEMRFVGAEVVSGGTWTLSNTSGSSTNLVIEDTVTGIDIPANDQAVIEITVELLNTSTNSSGLSFRNGASYIYNRSNGDGSTQAIGDADISSNMIVVEPALGATKAVSFAAPADKNPADPATVGDVLEYAITIPNSGDSTAFDTGVVDTLPEGVSLVPDSATAQIGGVDVAGFVESPATQPDGSLAWGRHNGDDTLDISAGQSLELTYQVTVESVTATGITNSVYVDWTSLDDTSTAERTGEGCPDISSPNDYCYGPASVTVNTVDNTSIAKSAVDDSYAETPSDATERVVRVGDTVTYDLTLNLQEYTTRNVVLEDVLPQGMALESFTVLAGSSFSYTLAEQPTAGDTGTLRWDFGDITNQPSNDETPVDSLVIRYVAKVVADAQPAGVVNDASIALDNLAKLSYAGGDPEPYPARLTAAETIDVRQPAMSSISKTDGGSTRTGTGTTADPYQVDLSTDVMNFRLMSCNEGLAPAYGVVIADLLAPEFDENDLAANPPVVKTGAETLTEGNDYTYSAPERGGEMRIALLDDTPVNPDECVTVEYNIGFHTDLTSSKSWSNQARLSEYRSLPLSGEGRLYASDDPAEVWMTNLVSDEQLLKTLESPTEATIGDEVVYQITVPAVPMNSALDDVVVTDTLPSALEYIGSSAVDATGADVTLTDNSDAPRQVNLAAGHIPAGEQVIITLRTRVANNEQADAGVSFTNTASYTYSGMPDGLDTASTSGPVAIVEPLVNVHKAVSESSPGSGDLLTYTLTFAAEGGGEGDNYSSAFDLSIEDSLGTGLAYVPGSATVAGEVLPDPLTSGDGVSEPQTLVWSPENGIDIDIAEGTETTVTYQVRVLDDVSPGQTLTNSVIGRWTGLNGDQGAVERTGSGTPVVNDYVTQPAGLSLTSRLAISFEKSVLNATTGEVPAANAQPGETLRYTLVLANESIAPLDNASVTDELAAQFAPGTLKVISISDPNADSSHTDAMGGDSGTGLLDIRNLTLGALGETDDTLTIEFEATLAPVIQSGTAILNQAQLGAENLETRTSNETSTLISSAPAFEIWKSSRDITGDPDELMAGDTLRYTLTVKNTGTENAVDTVLQDQIPANTTYVPNSTTLNGSPAPDPSAGVSALQGGLALNVPAGPTTTGFMRVDAADDGSNLATVTFDVQIDPTAMDGLVIENQGFVSASGEGSGPLPQQPSDDPDTAALLDPTRDVVGNLPLLGARKTVKIQNDAGTAGIVDPGDTLRYTIEIDNFGAVPATEVVLTDLVPADTSYVADSLRLNGVSPGSDGGVSPLIDGLPLQSSDQPGEGIVSAGSSALVTFDARVDDGVPSGTLISNQGSVTSNEMPPELTDADGNPSNGYQPTIIVVGAAQVMAVTKEVSIVGGGRAEAGDRLEYVVRATNIGSLPASNVIVSDDLGPLQGQVSYVAESALLNDSPAGVLYAGSMLTGDYGSVYGELPPGDSAVLRFQAQIDPLLGDGATITNTGVVRWSDPPQSASASVSLDLGGSPGSAALNGNIWHDVNLNRIEDGNEPLLEGWSVDLYSGSRILASTLSDASGGYRLSGLLPNEGAGEPYELRFRAPGAGPATPSLGTTDSPFSDGPQQITGITVPSGGNLQGLNLPITPNGAVYDSVQREPVAGARLAMLNATTEAPLPGRCFDDPSQQNQVTPLEGFYKFDLNFTDPSCQPGDTYFIEVTPPNGFIGSPSRIIPPNGEPVDPFSVPGCPGSEDDAVPSTPEYCEITASSVVPPFSALPRTDDTVYHLHLTLSDGFMPGESQAFNNHIPVDPELDGAVAISKTSPVLNTRKGELVPYTIAVENIFGVPLQDIGIADRFPAGFKYVKNSARLDGEPSEPQIAGTQLLWDGLDLQVNEKRTLKLLLAVGAGVSEGEYVNRAQVISTASGGAASGEATATVRVVTDPTFDCTDVIGKVFDDRNLNGQQDDGEAGLAGARVATARGLIATTDEHGRFHIACAMVPDEDRGSNFILKLDDRSLPTGYRVITENPRVQRATRGKMMKFNFGAAIHRVVRIDIADGVFEPESTELRVQWRSRMDRLLAVLQESPAILRLSYLADVEDESLVRKRLEALKQEVADRWDRSGGGYRLTVETEVFWRRGGPL